MKAVFADTLYWAAVARPDDPWAEPSRRAREALGEARLITTNEVLGEFLTLLSPGGPLVRRAAVEMVRAIQNNPNVRVVPQTRSSFVRAVERYAARLDKAYSLTDCCSMNTMDDEDIREILTNDHHFTQEGYVALIRR